MALGLLSTALKDLAVELGVFVMSSTQTNAKAKEEKNELSIRGARSIIDKCDLACILSRITDEEMQTMQEIFNKKGIIPNQVIDIYKNRRGKYTNVRIWCNNNLGNCRRQDLLITTQGMAPIEDFVPIVFQYEFDNDITKKINLFLSELNSEYMLEQEPAEDEKTIIDIDNIKVYKENKNKGLFGDLID